MTRKFCTILDGHNFFKCVDSQVVKSTMQNSQIHRANYTLSQRADSTVQRKVQYTGSLSFSLILDDNHQGDHFSKSSAKYLKGLVT
jgi:hypothetical protein